MVKQYYGLNCVPSNVYTEALKPNMLYLEMTLLGGNLV